MTVLLIALLSSALSLAGAFDAFMDGLSREYFVTKTARGKELTNHVRVTKLGGMNPDAAATYNPTFNSIGLQEDLLVNGNAIRGDIQDPSKISVIFHEMGHAEMDVFIENPREVSDLMIADAYKTSWKTFYQKTFPGFNAHSVFQEHFGYYRGELIEFFANEFQNVLINNGYNSFTNKCFMSAVVKQKKLEGVTLEEFQQFFVTNLDTDFYRNRINPGYLFVKGKDIDLNAPNVNQVIVKQIHQLFWSYHQDFYNFPINEKDLVARMNKQSKYKAALAECRIKLWNAPLSEEVE